MRYRFSSFITLLFLTISTDALCQDTAVRVTPNHESKQSVSSPALQVDADGGVYCAWVQPKGSAVLGPVLFSYSETGDSFSLPVSVVGDADAFSDYQRTPSFIIDKKGYIHIVWTGQRFQTTQTDIWYSWSFDKGKHWSLPVSLADADDSSLYYQDFPSIACDSSNNLYVSYIDYRETQRKHTPYPNVYISRSTDGGQRWDAGKKADNLPNGIGGASEMSVPRIEASPNGNLYVAFRANIKNDRRIWLARSFDRGLTFESSLAIQNAPWTIINCPSTPPAIALDENETADIVWRDVRDNDTASESHLYYAQVPVGSMVEPENMMLANPNGDGEEYPDIAVYDHSKARTISYQSATTIGRYLSYENGKSEIVQYPLPQGGHQRHVSVRFGQERSRNFLWLDSKLGKGDDIFFWRDTTSLTLDIAAVPATAFLLSVQTNPAYEQTLVTTSIDIPISAFIATDLLGRSFPISYSQQSNSSYRLDLRALSGGSYILSAEIQHSPKVLTTKLIVLH